VYVLSNDNDSGTCVAAALEPWTGEPVWRHRLPSFSFTANAMGGDRLFASCADGVLRVLDAVTGRPVTEASLGDPSTAPPAMTRSRSSSAPAQRPSSPANGWSASAPRSDPGLTRV